MPASSRRARPAPRSDWDRPQSKVRRVGAQSRLYVHRRFAAQLALVGQSIRKRTKTCTLFLPVISGNTMD
jgi:hypothetical protein